MRATLVDVGTIVSGTNHHAFTDLCMWRGNYFVAYRQAQSHDIVPKGVVMVHACHPHNMTHAMPVHEDDWSYPWCEIAHPVGDVRDPRFIPADEALYMICGVYLPAPHNHGVLSPHSTENLIMTHLTYTTDGITWAPLTPILRPQHWGWSVLAMKDEYLLASYVTGAAHEASSIVLWAGRSLLSMTPLLTIYEGGSTELEADGTLRYPSLSPSEMVLYRPCYGTIACLVRTSRTIQIGVTSDLTNWRWRECLNLVDLPASSGLVPRWFPREDILHPSAVAHTPHGILMAARRCAPVYKPSLRKKHDRQEIASYDYSTALYTMHAQFPRLLLTLPSGGDCGYAGLAPWGSDGEYLVSYYDASAYYKQGQFGTTLPAGDIKIAVVKISA